MRFEVSSGGSALTPRAQILDIAAGACGRNWSGTAAPPMCGGGGYWGKTGHASFYAARQLLTHLVTSTPSFDAMQNDQ